MCAASSALQSNASPCLGRRDNTKVVSRSCSICSYTITERLHYPITRPDQKLRNTRSRCRALTCRGSIQSKNPTIDVNNLKERIEILSGDKNGLDR